MRVSARPRMIWQGCGLERKAEGGDQGAGRTTAGSAQGVRPKACADGAEHSKTTT